MEQSLVMRKFTFDHEVRSDWSVDNIPLRFPNARYFEYHPIHIGEDAISIDIRRNAFNGYLNPPLDTLVDVLHKYTWHPLCITISWNAAAFSPSRWAPPPWKAPMGPDILPESIEPLKPYFNLLVNYILRWKAFRIFAPLVNHMKDEFSRIPTGGALALESLVIMDVEQCSEFNVLSGILLPLKQYSVNFRELLLFDNRDRAVVGVQPDPFSASIDKNLFFLPYEKLTSLRVDYKLHAMEAWWLISNCKRLVDCVFTSLTRPASLPDDLKVATSSSLQYLKLCSYDTDYAHGVSSRCLRYLLGKISTPNLKRLVLKCEGKWREEIFSAFIARSSCALQSLHIIKMGITAEQLVSCLDLAGDSLTELLLEDINGRSHSFMTPHFIKHFHYQATRKHKRDRPCLCPKLKVISIGDLSFNGSGDFGEALCSRVGVTPLSEVRLLCTDTTRKGTNIPEADVHKLQKLTEKGVHVYLARDPCDGL